MEKLYFISNGAVVGFLAGIVLICKSMYDGTFNWWRTMLTLPASVIVGYASYELLSLTSAPLVSVLVITIYASLNSFLFIEILTDKDITEQVFDKYIKKPILGDTYKKTGGKDKKLDVRESKDE